MKFKQFEDGSCDIEFDWRERFILFKKGKLHLSNEGLRHFGNNIMAMVMKWNLNFNEDIKKMVTHEDTEVKGK
jgi:hypothetical protein